MNVMRKRVRTALLCLLCAAAFLLPARAADADADLFYGYLLQRAGASDGAALLSDARSLLGEKDRQTYDALKVMVQEVAAGERTNTVLRLTYHGFPKYWSAADLGVDSIVAGNAISSDAVDALIEKMYASFFEDSENSPARVLHALQFDCPYEFYWFDGTNGYHYSLLSSENIGATYRNNQYYLYPDVEGFESSDTVDLTYEFSLPVSADYGEGYATDPALRDGIDAALTRAASIVESHAAESDYDKLLSYATEICALTDYNDYAAAHSDIVPYGNPWQMLHVFDGDPATTVVCEGYSKAFKYLCDLSAFQSPDVECRLASGTLDGGAHMWNVVTMDNGKHYLVDVTNSDPTDNPKYLFLKGGVPGNDGAYSFYGGNFVFLYSDKTLSTFGEDLLTLDTEDYQLPVHVEIRGCSLTLTDDIALNFYLSFDETVTSDGGAYVALADFGVTDRQTVSDAFSGTMTGVEGTVYRFTVHLPAKRMNDPITLSCHSGSGAAYTMRDPKGKLVSFYDYCIQDYLTLAKQQPDVNLSNLAALMSAYGYYAQILFNYNEIDAVTPSGEALSQINAVTADTLAPYAAVNTGSVAGLTPLGDNLTLEDSITQRYIFNVDGDISDYTFAIDGAPVGAKAHSSGAYCLEVPGVVAKNMDASHTLTIRKGNETFTHQCSTLSYACKALTSPDASEALRDLAKAMYCYHAAAKAYFYAA